MRFPRFLMAGVILSLALHGSGSAFFAGEPDEVSIAASEGGGVSVIGSLEDLVAGAKVEVVAETSPLDAVEPDAVPLDPVAIAALPPASKPVRVEAVSPDAAVAAVEGVTATDPVVPVTPSRRLPPQHLSPAETGAVVPPAEAAAPAEPVTLREPLPAARTADVSADRTPAKIARVDPAVPAEPVTPETDVLQPVASPLAEVTRTPRNKPKPPVARAEPKKTPDRTLRTAQRQGAETTARKGGEQVTSKTARSNANGRKEASSRDGGTGATSNYKGKVVAKLRRAKRYPRQAQRRRLTGTARVAFTISRTGSVSGIRLTRSSGHALLDEAALDMVRRASPMPKFPGDITAAQMRLQVPVRFDK